MKDEREIIRTQVRIPEPLGTKARVLAALRHVSLNQVLIDGVSLQVDAWEKEHGEIPVIKD